MMRMAAKYVISLGDWELLDYILKRTFILFPLFNLLLKNIDSWCGC